jgi:NAD dependent epimerase/dehydratase family enzyme
MQTLITGGTGFVGRSLCAHLMNQGHRVTVIGTRRRSDAEIGSDPYTYIAADTTQPGDWQQAVAQSDLIVNLTGRTIFKRWTRRYKEQIYDSRILTTRHLVSALPEKSRAILLSTSAVGYYGDGEVDLAMLHLFGAPHPEFQAAYGPLAPGWQVRRSIYQLWPALVHVRLFGSGYHGMVAGVLDRFGV